MGLFERRWPPPSQGAADPLTERCDRCPAAGRFQVAKHIGVPSEVDGLPHAVDTRDLDLVLCSTHRDRHAPALMAGGWRVLEDRR